MPSLGSGLRCWPERWNPGLRQQRRRPRHMPSPEALRPLAGGDPAVTVPASPAELEKLALYCCKGGLIDGAAVAAIWWWAGADSHQTTCETGRCSPAAAAISASDSPRLALRITWCPTGEPPLRSWAAHQPRSVAAGSGEPAGGPGGAGRECDRPGPARHRPTRSGILRECANRSAAARQLFLAAGPVLEIEASAELEPTMPDALPRWAVGAAPPIISLSSRQRCAQTREGPAGSESGDLPRQHERIPAVAGASAASREQGLRPADWSVSANGPTRTMSFTGLAHAIPIAPDHPSGSRQAALPHRRAGPHCPTGWPSTLGCRPVSMNAPQVGIVPRVGQRRARILEVRTDRLRNCSRPMACVVVVAGFQGNQLRAVQAPRRSPHRARGGSEHPSAVAPGAAIGGGRPARSTPMWPGVLSTDPRQVAGAS